MSERSETAARGLEAIVLAAGKGTRMGGDRAKVLHEAAGRPMIDWVIDACEGAGSERNVIVVGHEAERVRRRLAGRAGCVFVEQGEQLGTGHAVMRARPLFEGRGAADVLVLYGDGPLIRAETLRRLVAAHRRAGAAATLATAVLADPSGYGRIIRDAAGRFIGIVEDRDADAQQRAIREVNPGYYCFRAADLFAALDRIDNDNARGEYYLTDAPGVLAAAGKTVEVVTAAGPEEALSVNTPQQLREVERILLSRSGAEAGA